MFKVREKGQQFLSNCPSGLVCVCENRYPLSHTDTYGILSTMQGSGEQ